MTAAVGVLAAVPLFVGLFFSRCAWTCLLDETGRAAILLGCCAAWSPSPR